MKKVHLLLSMGLLLASCSEKGNSPILENPNNDNIPVFAEVSPLKPLASVDTKYNKAFDALSEFAFAANKQVMLSHADGDGSCVFSPASAAVYLAMMAETVDDSDKNRVYNLLGVEGQELAGAINEMMRRMKLNSDVNGVSASVWHAPDLAVSDTYRNRMAENFGAPVNALDFYDPASVDLLDSWARDHTNGAIESVGAISPAGDVLLLTGLVCNKEWFANFKPEETTKGIFHGTNGDTEVDMMNKFEILEQPYSCYKGVEYTGLRACTAMLHLLLPPADMSEADFVELFTKEFFSEIRNRRRLVDMDMSMPKFETRCMVDLKKPLQELGLDDSPMSVGSILDSGTASLDINHSQIAQKIRFKLDEYGFETSVLTMALYEHGPRTHERERVRLNVDRPFYFVITEGGTKDPESIILFGRINNISE